jgi:retron-type reverse transcriptase
MSLQKNSIEWAVEFVLDHSDGDLFPKLPEMEAIGALKDQFADEIIKKSLSDINAGASRRFLVPKDEISYRQATQLDPQDSIILSSLMYEYGGNIESRRLSKDFVYSYRFNPTKDHGLYDSQSGWNSFWTKAKQISLTAGSIIYCDISDFYNQIYHHTVENQLIESGLPNQAIRWIISLLESTTAGVSRGVPVGPHAIHLIAEASLIPVDNSLSSYNLKFLRYADDILVFCDSHKDAQKAFRIIANVLDKQQRLTIQRHKSKIMDKSEFILLCNSMIEDRPINNKEKYMLDILKKYSKNDPYKMISYNSIDSADWSSISEANIRNIILEYIDKDRVDFIRLRWFYRRLAQVGHPGALGISLDRIDDLTPCLASICNYISSIQTLDNSDWLTIGTKLLLLMDSDLFAESEYYKLSVLSLFSRNLSLNHISEIISLYTSGDPFVRREVLLAAGSNKAADWLREHKESFENMDPWQRRAFVYCLRLFPKDERKFFAIHHPQYRIFDQILMKWAKS